MLGAQLEQAIHEAEDIVIGMQGRNFRVNRDKAEVELEISKEWLDRIGNFHKPVKVMLLLYKLECSLLFE